MKTYFTLFISFLLAGNLFAQHNRAYDTNQTSDEIRYGECLEASDRNSVFVGFSENRSNGGSYAIVTKVDQLGLPIWDTKVSPDAVNMDDFRNTYAIIETEDDGYLVAGYAATQSTSDIFQPMLFKLSSSGSLLWCKVYHNINSVNLPVEADEKPSLCKLHDGSGDYFITLSAISHYINTDVSVNVLRVSADGGLVWSKKYEDVDLSIYPQLRNMPADMEYNPDNDTYMIVGSRSKNDQPADQIFYLGIDANGSITLQWAHYLCPGDVKYLDMVYDPIQRQFATVHTIISSSLVRDNCVNNIIGLQTVDGAASNVYYYYYWDSKRQMNAGKSISLGADGKYMIGATTVKCDDPNMNAAFLKVDRATGTPVFYKEYDDAYNPSRSGFGGSMTCSQSYSSGEEYFIVSALEQGGVFHNCRAIRTDFNGDACSMVECTANSETYSPEFSTSITIPVPIGEAHIYYPHDLPIRLVSGRCEDGPIDQKSLAPDDGTQIGEVERTLIFPTVINALHPVINISGSNLETCRIEVVSANGSLVYSANLLSEINRLSLGNLADGMYVVLVREKDGAIRTHQKMSIVK